MAFDAHKNLAIATVTTATGAAGTTLGVAAGQGARFPAVPFNATVWPFDMAPDPTTAEVVRVTARTTDTLTITRAQEGTTVRAIIAGDLIAATITAKTLTDLESGTNFPVLASAGHILTGGDFVLTSSGASIRANTPDGADTAFLQFTGGGAGGQTRGAGANFFGNEWDAGARAGSMDIFAGDTVNGCINFMTAALLTRGRIHRSGGLSWGDLVDPGAGAMRMVPQAAGVPGLVILNVGVGQNFPISFQNANGQVGWIGTLASATTYSTTSDARLKIDRGRLVDLDVLRRTVIHEFAWTIDGTPGRGVFAQEAAAVAPFAVTVGTDETDDAGRLTHPWGVDYSKYVPDLITGWQAHDATILALEDKVARLEATVAALLARLG